MNLLASNKSESEILKDLGGILRRLHPWRRILHGLCFLVTDVSHLFPTSGWMFSFLYKLKSIFYSIAGEFRAFWKN